MVCFYFMSFKIVNGRSYDNPCKYLIVFEPREALCCEDEPVVLGPAFHDADVTDRQPALAYNLNKGQKEDSSTDRINAGAA